MIGFLEGKVIEENHLGSNPRLLILVSGVGYDVQVSEIACQEITNREAIRLFIHTHVREDEISLYGFQTAFDKEVFELVLSVSGIGPRVALGILSSIHSHDLLRVISEADLASLKKLPGIGKKTAERMILELQEKIKKRGLLAGMPRSQGATAFHSSEKSPLMQRRGDAFQTALNALKELGYKEAVAEETLALVFKRMDGSQEPDLSHVMKESLKELNRF